MKLALLLLLAAHARPESFASASIAIAAPADLAEVPAGDVQIDFRVTKFPLGEGDPPAHAHLVVDNEPALEADAAQVTLSGLAPGPHLLRAVLCKPRHEVLKGPHAFALVRFWVGPRTDDAKKRESAAWPDLRKPILTYVLPPGLGDLSLEPESFNDVEAPVLDFYLSNAKLGRRGAKLRVVLDRKELRLVTEWKPLALKAAPGAHRLTVDLLDRRGRKVRNVVNRTDRKLDVP